jgi:hypothetical protein
MDVYVELGDNSKPKIPFGAGNLFSFQLYLKNSDFPLYTDFKQLPKSNNDFQITYAAQSADNVFARLDIQRDWTLIDGASIELGFLSKPVNWVYYLISNLSGSNPDFSIVSQNASNLTWKAVENGTDPVSKMLADQYQHMRRLQFVSEQVYQCTEAGLKNIHLMYGGNNLIENLPNPSYRNYFQINRDASMGNGDAIFHIVKYVTSTTFTKV